MGGPAKRVRTARRLKKRLVKEFRRKAVAEQVERPRVSAAIYAQWVMGQDNTAMVARVRRTHVPLRRNAAQRLVCAAAHALDVNPVSLRWDAARLALSLMLPGSKPSGWRAAYPWGLPVTALQHEAQWHRERLAAMETQARHEDAARGEVLKAHIQAGVERSLSWARPVAEAMRENAFVMCACGHSVAEHCGGWCTVGRKAWECGCKSVRVAEARP